MISEHTPAAGCAGLGVQRAESPEGDGPRSGTYIPGGGKHLPAGGCCISRDLGASPGLVANGEIISRSLILQSHSLPAASFPAGLHKGKGLFLKYNLVLLVTRR